MILFWNESAERSKGEEDYGGGGNERKDRRKKKKCPWKKEGRSVFG